MTIDFRVGAPIRADKPPHRPSRTLYGEAYGRISAEQQDEIPDDAQGLLKLMDEQGITHAVLPVEDN